MEVTGKALCRKVTVHISSSIHELDTQPLGSWAFLGLGPWAIPTTFCHRVQAPSQGRHRNQGTFSRAHVLPTRPNVLRRQNANMCNKATVLQRESGVEQTLHSPMYVPRVDLSAKSIRAPRSGPTAKPLQLGVPLMSQTSPAHRQAVGPPLGHPPSTVDSLQLLLKAAAYALQMGRSCYGVHAAAD